MWRRCSYHAISSSLRTSNASSGVLRVNVACNVLLPTIECANPLLSGLFHARRNYATNETVIKATWKQLPKAPVKKPTGVAVVDQKAYVVDDSSLLSYDLNTGTWSDQLRVEGSLGGTAIAWGPKEIVTVDPTKKKLSLNKTNAGLSILALDGLKVDRDSNVPLLQFKATKTESPKRLWVMGESYENSGNAGDQMPIHVGYWEKKSPKDKGQWFSQNANTLNVTGPAPREKKEIYVATVNDMLYVLSTSEDQQTIEVRTFDPVKFSWKVVEVKGQPPEPRIGASVSVLGSKIILFGGHAQVLSIVKIHTQEVLCFDTDKAEWETVQTTGDKPKGRSGHQAINLGNNELLFIGGTNELRKMSDSVKLTFHF